MKLHAPLGWRRHWLAATLVASALMMSLTSTLGLPLLPTFATQYGITDQLSQWALTASLLSGVIAIPLLARMADQGLGRRALLFGIGAVAIGSLLCALAPSFGILIAGRALQGFGFGLVPVAMSLAQRMLPFPAAPRTVAVLSVTVILGSGIGYPLSGLAADLWGFRAVFWGALLLSAAIFAVVVIVLPAGPAGPPAGGRFDLAGTLSLSLGLTLLVLALSQGPVAGWSLEACLALTAAGIATLAAWVIIELRTADPLVPLGSLAAAPVVLANIAALCVGAGMYVATSFVTRIAQTPGALEGFAPSALAGGLMVTPLSAGSLIAAILLNRAPGMLRPGIVLPASLAIMAGSLVWLGLAPPEIVQVIVAMLILGTGMGGAFASMSLIIIDAVADDRTAGATGANQLVRTLGGAVGSSAVGSAIALGGQTGATQPTYLVTAACLAIVGLVCAVAFGRRSGDSANLPNADGTPFI